MEMTLEQALGELTTCADYGIYVVTAASGEEVGGCLVAFSTQASLDPVRFLVLLSHRAHTYGLVEDSAACALHWLDRGQDKLARHFGEKTGFETNKLEGLDWEAGETGSPVLAEPPGYVELELRHRLVCGDHTAYLGDPVKAEYRHPFQPYAVQDAFRADIHPLHWK